MKKLKLLLLGCLMMLGLLLIPMQASAAVTPLTLTIVSNQNTSTDPGHAFLVITNRSSGTVKVGPYFLRKGKQLCLGMRDGFREHLSATGGAYFNVESAYPGPYKSFTYKSIALTTAQANTIANYFRLNSYYDDLGDVMFHNCTTFAIRAWNKVAPASYRFKESAIDLPSDLKKAIGKLPGAKSGTNLLETVLKTRSTTGEVYYIDQDAKIIPYRVVSTKFMRAEVLNCNQIKLTWQQASDQNISGQKMVTGYTICYADPQGNEKHINITGDKVTQYVVRGLKANTEYKFIMAPVFKDAGFNIEGKASSIVKRTTQNCKVTLNRTTATLNLAKARRFTLKAVSSGKHPTNLTKIIWRSSNPSVASVSSNGVVTGWKNGTAIIQATIHGRYARCKVTVYKPAIKLNRTTATIQVKQSLALKATVVGPSKKVSWKSSNTKIATVTSTGIVKGLKKGTVTITASANGVKAVCKVTVIPLTNRLDLAPYLGKDISVLSKRVGINLKLYETGWYNPRDYLSGKCYVRQFTPEGDESSFYYTSAFYEFASPKNSSILNAIAINGYYTTEYSIHGVYVRMPMSTAENLLLTKGWKRLTDAQKKAYGLGDVRYSDSYGYADERYYVKNGYLLYISDNNSWNYFDPHSVHNVIYGRAGVLLSKFLEKDGHIEICD